MTEKGNMPAQAGANKPKTLQGLMNSPAMVKKLNGILGNEVAGAQDSGVLHGRELLP